jgi:putative alpha-1,2-mannosidase
LHLENGKDFVISAPNKTAKRVHVKSVKLNGKEIKDYKLTHQQIVAGGILEFRMK